MIDNNLAAVLAEQRQDFLAKDLGVIREKLTDVSKYVDNELVVVISGLRRSGKSTLLRQIVSEYYYDQDFFYINFEDERLLGFETKEFNKLLEILIEHYGDHKTFFIDEIQNIEAWELFVRRLSDSGYKFYITGSNAELLSRELGSRLTGRHIMVELFPFSFNEYLSYKQQPQPTKLATTKERALTNQRFVNYLREGSVPLSLKLADEEFNLTLYQNIIYRDVLVRYGIQAEKQVKELARYLASNIACPIAFNKLRQYLQIAGITTVKNYIEHLESAWLFFVINIFDSSVKRQQIAAKKVYCIDPGLAQTIGFSISDRFGQIFENFVFLDLRRYWREVYYYKTEQGFEVDFWLPSKKLLVQACYDITNAETREREIRALEYAMDELGLKEAWIVTPNLREELKLGKKLIKIIRAYDRPWQ